MTEEDQNAQPQTPVGPTSESKYPDRPFELTRLTSTSKNAGTNDYKFIKDFRKSPYFFRTELSTTQDATLHPSRKEFVTHLKAQTRNFPLPAALLRAEDGLEVEKADGGSQSKDSNDKLRFEWKNQPTVSSEDVQDIEKPQEEEDTSDANKSEDEDDLGGDYGLTYGQLETGEGDDGDDSDAGSD